MSNTDLVSQGQRIPFSQLISSKAWQQSITNTLRDPKKVDRFTAAIISAVTTTPALQECDPKTIINGALLGEALGLSPSPQLGQYYLVPFENRKKGCKDAQFVLGYKGYVQLALRSGYYKRLNVMAVKQGELERFDPLTEDISLRLIQDETEREKAPVIGYVAMFEYLNGFTKTIYWSREKMIAHADRYSPAFSKDATSGKYPKVSFEDYCNKNYPAGDEWKYSSFWYKDFDAMAYKTMLRQLISKWGVMSTELQRAIEQDTDADYVVDDMPLPELPAQASEEDLQPDSAPMEQKQVSLDDVD